MTKRRSSLASDTCDRCTANTELFSDDESDSSLCEDCLTGREVSRKNMSHADCSHPRTPKGRAACRKARAS